MKIFPDFPWPNLNKLLPGEIPRFCIAARLIGGNEYYGFKKDLGEAASTRYKFLGWVGKELLVKVHLMVCEKSSTYLPQYQMHILPFDELLLICSCTFVVEHSGSYSGRAVTNVLTRQKPRHPRSRMACIFHRRQWASLLPGIASLFDSSFLPV